MMKMNVPTKKVHQIERKSAIHGESLAVFIHP